MSNSDFSQPTQRAGALIRTIGLAIALVALGSAVNQTAHSQTTTNAMKPIPIPAQVPAKDGVAQIPDSRLWYWDTGGTGVPIVLLHPSTGSALIWGYQQPVFAKAGYRVIAYSRRGYYNSAPYDPNNRGIGSEDLRYLVDALGLGRFHIVASAAGGSIASDFAFSYQERLLSLTISSNSFGVRDGEIAKAAAFIRPKGFEQLPPEFREIGPSYRAANPEGVKAWIRTRAQSADRASISADA
jgi:pimeloyl-ACP methyl ester carboxylesterase